MEIKVKSLGEDGFNRETYKNVENGAVYALVDGRFHSTSRDGEPESPLRDDVVVMLDKQKKEYSDGEPKAPLRDDLLVMSDKKKKDYSIGELLVIYIGIQRPAAKMLHMRSEEEGIKFMKSAKFHGVDALYCYRQMKVPSPVKEGQFMTPTVYYVAERRVVDSLISKEGFVCPSRKS
jgi:hypothetical protein